MGRTATVRHRRTEGQMHTWHTERAHPYQSMADGMVHAPVPKEIPIERWRGRDNYAKHVGHSVMVKCEQGNE